MNATNQNSLALLLIGLAVLGLAFLLAPSANRSATVNVIVATLAGVLAVVVIVLAALRLTS